MRAPTAEELAAIAAAYLTATAPKTSGPERVEARWQLAGRLPSLDPARVRVAAQATSRWNAAGRLDA